MKIALLYSVWTGDDMDMLYDSIKHHIDNVDEILVCYQRTSNTGNDGGLVFSDRFKSFESISKKVKILNFEPNTSLNTKENERIKHNQMIQFAKKQGFTHFILCACDHFYDDGTFATAKNLHLTLDLDVTFTKMVTYYKNDNWAVWPLENYYMPFIHKMYPETEISKNVNYPVRVDPSVKVNTFQHHYVMDVKQGFFHHYSMVRKDIKKKFRNAASSIRWTEKQVETFISEYDNAKIGDKITYFQGAELMEIGKILKLMNV